MRRFKDLMEAPDTIVFGFGRFNPPTTGHEKLIQKTASVAGSNPYRIYPSFTQNPKNDPLPHALKVAYMRKMFKKYARNIIADKDAKTVIHIAVKLYDEGFKNLVMVAGSDRIKEFDTLLNTYNGVEGKRHGYYKFDSIDIVNAGQRDPDSEGVEGMSASKMRVAASNGDMDSFLQGVPSGFSDGKKLYRDVRKYMGIREERDMGDMTDFETLRDAYLTGKVWNVGDVVEANGVVGEVVRKGTNYLSFMTEDNKVHKAWLHEINEGVIELDEGLIDKIKRLKDFREQGKWINSVEDFQKVTKVSDSLLKKISPSFKFPDWVLKRNASAEKSAQTLSPSTKKKDLNTATQEELMEIYGVGETMSQRILNYKLKIGGFVDNIQLKDIYGLPYETEQNILKEFSVQDPKPIQKISINKASVIELSEIIYFDYELAREIVNYRKLHEGIKTFEELAKIESFPAYKIDRIKLYVEIN